MNEQTIELEDEYEQLLERCYRWYMDIALTHRGKIKMIEDGRKLKRFKKLGLMYSEDSSYGVSFYFTPDGLLYCMQRFAPPFKTPTHYDLFMREQHIGEWLDRSFCLDLLRRLVDQYDTANPLSHEERQRINEAIGHFKQMAMWHMKRRAN